jgi:hypothetical protein
MKSPGVSVMEVDSDFFAGWHVWALEDGSLNFIFDRPDEAFAFKMVWG